MALSATAHRGRAEIRGRTEFVEWERIHQQQREAEELARDTTALPSVIDYPQTPEFREGLIWHKENLVILGRCIDLLLELRTEIETHGLTSSNGVSLLGKVYGERPGGHSNATVADLYARCRRGEEVAKDDKVRQKYRILVLSGIDSEIAVLSTYNQELRAVESHRLEVEKLRQSVPDGPALDRLIRYGASLQREFDRALSQLERLQRMRLGQPVPPPVHVELSGR